MSAEAVIWAWQQKCTSSGDKLTLVAFAWEADSEGATFIGPKKLKSYTGLEEAGLRKCIARLAKSGLLTRFRRHRANGSEGSAFTLLSIARETPFPFDHYEFVIGERIDGPYPRGQGYPSGYPPTLSLGIPLEQELHKNSSGSKEPEESSASVREVYEYWREKLSPQARLLTRERSDKIKTRLKSFSVVDLKLVIDYVAADPFYLGQNDSGRPYKDITTIFKTDTKVAEFLENGMPKRANNGNGRSRRNGYSEPDYEREKAARLALRDS